LHARAASRVLVGCQRSESERSLAPAQQDGAGQTPRRGRADRRCAAVEAWNRIRRHRRARDGGAQSLSPKCTAAFRALARVPQCCARVRRTAGSFPGVRRCADAPRCSMLPNQRRREPDRPDIADKPVVRRRDEHSAGATRALRTAGCDKCRHESEATIARCLVAMRCKRFTNRWRGGACASAASASPS
jgi:hypothetical protein